MAEPMGYVQSYVGKLEILLKRKPVQDPLPPDGKIVALLHNAKSGTKHGNFLYV